MAAVPISLFAASVLAAIGQPVTQENVAKMTAWWQWESGGGTNGASWNPADIIMGGNGKDHPDPPGTVPFNSFTDSHSGATLHVAKYPDAASGVLTTATYIKGNDKLFHAFDKGVSYNDGLSRITGFMAAWADPKFMQNLQNTKLEDAINFGKTAMNKGEQVTDTTLNQLAVDPATGAAVFIDPITSNPFDSTQGGVNPLDAGGVGLFNNPLDAIKGVLSAVTQGAFWKRVLYVLGGLVLIFGGLFMLAGRLEKAGDIPSVTPVPV